MTMDTVQSRARGGSCRTRSELFVDTIGFVLENRRRAERQDGLWRNDWNMASGQVQLVSLEACRAWRDTTHGHLRVTDATPDWLWKHDEGVGVTSSKNNRDSHNSEDNNERSRDGGVKKTRALSRVPTMRIARVTWERTIQDLRDNSLSAPAFLHARVFTFGRMLNESLAGIMWPSNCSIERLTFGRYFNQPLGDFEWPTALTKLKFGYGFNQDLKGVTWPPSLRELAFGDSFNQPITEIAAAWPTCLETVTFGESFNQEISGVKWPTGLRRVVFEWRFNSSLEGVMFSDKVEELELRGLFNQPLAALPVGLKKLYLGAAFNQPIDRVNLPQRLQKIVFGVHFNQPINAVNWPQHLESITFGYAFNQPVNCTVWPQRLRNITFGHSFNQSLIGVSWPEETEEINLGWQFDQPLRGVTWPTGETNSINFSPYISWSPTCPFDHRTLIAFPFDSGLQLLHVNSARRISRDRRNVAHFSETSFG